MGANNSCEISRLPEDCLSRIISLTSPRDACRCSAVSSSFRSAAAADAVWRHFLPTDIENILSSDPDRPVFASKKDLYVHLTSHGILVDDGKMSLMLDKLSGAKIYILSATRGAIVVIWGDSPRYWQRVPNYDSRFSEVRQLILVWWLDIYTHFSSKNLTPRTTYAAYFIFKLEDDSSGLDLPIEGIVIIGDEEFHHRICLQTENATSRQNPNNPIRYAQVRDDKWLEVEIGEFYNDGEEDDQVEARVQEKKNLWAKRGLIFNGIEFRPKRLATDN